MSDNGVKVEFAVGSEVSMEQFFKSSFARSFVENCRDAKSLNAEFFNCNENSNESLEIKTKNLDVNRNDIQFSLKDFTKLTANIEDNDDFTPKKMSLNEAEIEELNQLRKRCQALTEENRQLQIALEIQQEPQAQAIDNAHLLTQLDTLQWQLKQLEANRQMHRSLMKQVMHFLDRARKSLDIMHTNNSTRKNALRNNRSQSVYMDVDISGEQSRIGTPISDTKFTRAKSVAQISMSSSSSTCSGIRDFTWSILKRNDPVHCTPIRVKRNEQRPVRDNLNKTLDDVPFRSRHESIDIKSNNDYVPPEKLSQEASRLSRTIQSLVSMQDPLLLAVPRAESTTGSSSSSSGVAVDEDHISSSPVEHEISLSVNKIANSTLRHNYSFNDYALYNHQRSDNSTIFNKSSSLLSSTSSTKTVQASPVPPHQSYDATSVNSANSKTEEEETSDQTKNTNLISSRKFIPLPLSSIPKRRFNKIEHNHSPRLNEKPKSIVSSAEDESGFSSLSSFQDVGLPQSTANSLSLLKGGGCHTEIGLPEIPLDKVNHRRWSSTPAEMQALFKKYKNGFMANRGTTETLSVWV